MRFATLRIAAVVFCGVAAGCGSAKPRVDYRRLDLVEVSGRVTLDDLPVAAAEVIVAAADGTFSRGITDAAGRYRLWYDSRQPGVTKGPKVVRIRGTPVSGDEADPDALPVTRETLPARYNSGSILRINVEQASAGVDFHLHAAGSAETSAAERP